MPRKNAKTATAEQSVSTEPMATATLEAPASSASPATHESAIIAERGQAADAGKLSDLPDPRGQKIAALGADRNGPKIELLRSHRYNQMQVRSDEPLSEKHQGMLTQAGWTDRMEKEGIWTKQLPKEQEKWRDVADAEKLFKQIANEMRADKGLGPVLSI
jgi:hypothetical protein